MNLPEGDGQEREKEKNLSIEANQETSQDDFRTRGSLLLRLNASGTMEREIGWKDFYDRYVPLIKGFARRAGAGEEVAEDVAHEVIANFFRASHRFQYDASAGRFRGYLKAATLNAMRAKRGSERAFGSTSRTKPGFRWRIPTSWMWPGIRNGRDP